MQLANFKKSKFRRIFDGTITIDCGVNKEIGIENINILYESNAVCTTMKEKVKNSPVDLFGKLFDYRIARVLDEEDLGRVMMRKEVMFYHQVLENSLDHLLQALFAVNSTYFPCRKRSDQYLNTFKNKPTNCCERLLRIIENSISSRTIEESVRELRNFTIETVQVGDLVYKRDRITKQSSKGRGNIQLPV